MPLVPQVGGLGIPLHRFASIGINAQARFIRESGLKLRFPIAGLGLRQDLLEVLHLLRRMPEHHVDFAIGTSQKGNRTKAQIHHQRSEHFHTHPNSPRTQRFGRTIAHFVLSHKGKTRYGTPDSSGTVEKSNATLGCSDVSRFSHTPARVILKSTRGVGPCDSVISGTV